MKSLFINPQHALASRNGESLGVGRGLFFWNHPNIKNNPNAAQAQRDQETTQLNQTM